MMKIQATHKAPFLRWLSDVPDHYICKICGVHPVLYLSRCLHTMCDNCFEALCAPAFPLPSLCRPAKPSLSTSVGGSAEAEQAFWGCPKCHALFPTEIRQAMFIHQSDNEIAQIEVLSSTSISSSSFSSSSAAGAPPLFKVSCLAAGRGCVFSSSLKEVISHELNCEHLRFPCHGVVRGCPHEAPHAIIQKHSKTCRFVPGVRYCKYHRFGCKARGTPGMLLRHEKKCSKISQKQPTKCPFSKLGCGLKPKQYYVAYHAGCCLFRPDACTIKPGEPTYRFELQLAYLPHAKEMMPTEVVSPQRKHAEKASFV